MRTISIPLHLEATPEDGRDLLEFLNSPNAYREVWQHGQYSRLEMLAETASGQGKEPDNEGTNMLRHIVNEWIATGRNPDGVEDPWSRRWSTKKSGELWKQVLSLSEITNLYMPGNNLELTLPLAKHAELHTDLTTAKHLLFLMMVSNLRFQVANCVGCGSYFLLTNRRYVHKKGTRCADCYARFRNEDSAEITKRHRDEKRQAVYSSIATKFGKAITQRKDWHSDEKLVQRIVSHVNASIESGKIDHPPLTGKWVVRQTSPDNRTAISKAVEDHIKRPTVKK